MSLMAALAAIRRLVEESIAAVSSYSLFAGRVFGIVLTHLTLLGCMFVLAFTVSRCCIAKKKTVTHEIRKNQ